MKTLRKILLVLMLLLPMAVAGIYLFKTLDARNGLTISQITCIMKDSRGYIWLGTPAGLYRYDGYTFHSFQSNSQDGSSLPDSYIISIQETLEGTLLVQTSAGYCIYHPQSENFERDVKQTFSRMGIESVPNVVYIDSHKNVWASIPNKGVIAYNMQQQTSYEFSYTNDAHGIPQGTICSIGECRDGAVLVYEDGTIVCCDIIHQQHTVWQNDQIAREQLRKTNTLRVFSDQMDNIWLYGQGTLMLYNKNTNTWNTTIGNQGNIWIGTDRTGLIRTTVNNHEMEYIQPHSANSNQKTQDIISIQSVYIDDTDLLWIGTEKSGLAYYGNNIYKFETDFIGDITALAQDKNGKVWYGTGDKGIIGYDGALASHKVSVMTTTPDGSLWVGSNQNGLTRIKNGSSTFYSVARDSMKTLIDDHINALTCG